ncbi:MAG TPA: RNA polymerase sigma factor [Chthoniobacterales bacterium]
MSSAKPPDFVDALRPHYADALRYCRALCAGASSTEADDVLQQSLLLALRGYDSLHEAEKFRSWLFRIITREYLSQRRRGFWRRFLPLHALQPKELALLVYSDAHWNQEQQRLMAALARLGERDRSALLLEVAGLSLEEIRLVQGDRSMSAVKSRVSRARARLRAMLESPLRVAGSYPPLADAALAAIEEPSERSDSNGS